MTQVLVGLMDFTRPKDLTGGGLGPYYNALNCSTCHFAGGVGGMGDVETAVSRVDHPLAEKWIGGPILHRYRLPGFPEKIPPPGAVIARRVAPPLFGIGTFEQVSDSDIRSREDREDKDGDGISGRAAQVGSGIGRYGFKGVEVTLKDFVRRAVLQELGANSNPAEVPRSQPDTDGDGVLEPEMSEGGLDVIVTFIRALPIPIRHAPQKPGLELFKEIGCSQCHVPEMSTTDGPIAPFTDLLLHDMGDPLADGIEEGSASGREFRTASLWGMNIRKVYLHDGRASTLHEAIALHGGEARVSRDRYMALGGEHRWLLQWYLNELYDTALQLGVYGIDPGVERVMLERARAVPPFRGH